MPLADGSFVYAREDQGAVQLFQYELNGSTIPEIGAHTAGRGVGAGGILFDGIVGLVPESSSALILLAGFDCLAACRRR